MPNAHAAPPVFVRRVNGAWWFVDADAQLFVSIGLNHVEAPLMLGEHNRHHTIKRYGDDFVLPDGSWNPDGEGAKRWLSRVRADMKQWGFNTFGYHTLAPRDMLGGGMYYVQRAGAYGIEPYRRNPVLPDLFSTECEAEIRRRVAQICAVSRTDPYCLGYAFADRPPWSTATATGLHPWVARLAASPASTPGKKAWMKHLLTRYDDVEAVAAAYGLGAQSWDDLAAVDDWSTVGDPEAVRADSGAMLAQLAERWYRMHSETIRQHDPHRLILGDKLHCGASGIPEFLVPILTRYTNLLYIEWFAEFAEQEAVLRNLHEQTELPILLGNSGFAVQNEGESLRTKGLLVDDHLRAGQCYADYLRAAMESGFVVGWHYCGYMEGRQGVSPEYDPDLERLGGLLDPFENEHSDALAWLRVANEHANVWHARTMP